MIQEEGQITALRFSNRSSADVYFGDKTVRIPGEIMDSYFLADPYEMFWLDKEDREVWPWKLPEEKRKNRLSEAETAAVMETVSDYYLHRKEPIIFLTREMEERSLALADMIKARQISRWRAAAMFRKEFPDLSARFCKAMITDALAGIRWYS